MCNMVFNFKKPTLINRTAFRKLRIFLDNKSHWLKKKKKKTETDAES